MSEPSNRAKLAATSIAQCWRDARKCANLPAAVRPRNDLFEVKQDPAPERKLEDPYGGVSEASYMFGFPTGSLNDPTAAFDAYEAIEDQEQ